MATWRRIIGGSGEWPLYFDRGALTDQFGRFCIQPVEKEASDKVAGLFRKALRETLPGAAVAAFRIRLQGDWVENSGRENVVSRNLSERLQEVRMVSAGCFPMNGYLRKSGPGPIRSSDLSFGTATQLLPEDFVLTMLLPGESLELDILVEWGKGELSAAHPLRQKLPRGWIQLDRDHSPVRNVRIERPEIGSRGSTEQVIVEIQTDGSISPEDAVRRASYHMCLPSQALPPKAVSARTGT